MLKGEPGYWQNSLPAAINSLIWLPIGDCLLPTKPGQITDMHIFQPFHKISHTAETKSVLCTVNFNLVLNSHYKRDKSEGLLSPFLGQGWLL